MLPSIPALLTIWRNGSSRERLMIAIPVVSSQRRNYIPIDLKNHNVISGNKIFVMENGGMFDFGILTSKAHNDWMRLTCGRMKSDYSYSGTIVYNTFPFPTVTDEQKKHIEQLAEEILLTREDFAGDTLAKLYDPETMPESLKIAHQNLDDAVDKLYNPKGFADTASRLAHLLERYETLINAEKQQQAIDKKGKKMKTKKDYQLSPQGENLLRQTIQEFDNGEYETFATMDDFNEAVAQVAEWNVKSQLLKVLKKTWQNKSAT